MVTWPELLQTRYLGISVEANLPLRFFALVVELSRYKKQFFLNAVSYSANVDEKIDETRLAFDFNDKAKRCFSFLRKLGKTWSNG